MTDELVTTVEAARRLGVSRQRIQQYIDAGRLPARKVGRDLLIEAGTLAALERKPVGRPPRTRDAPHPE